MSPVGADIRIRGLVQGVGYRHFCYRQAMRMGLVGWVRNCPDSSVEVRVEGDRSGVEALIAELKIGPSNASVTDLAVKWTEYTSQYTSFDITR
jgi:acylphosphatase